MSSKRIEIPDVGEIKLVKSKQNRNLRLTVTADGVRVSMPSWMPYSAGAAYALKHTDWIRRNARKTPQHRVIKSGDRIGRLHTAEFATVIAPKTPQTRVTATKLIVQHSPTETVDSPTVQARALEGARKALKKEADIVLPPRLEDLANKHGFTYSSVSTKRLKRRWGSCDSKHNIVLNYYLMELPWDCIDYVLLHELTHTIHLHHGPDFWHHMKQVFPRVDDVKKQLRSYQPMLRSDQPD